jgi:hypothetical protein
MSFVDDYAASTKSPSEISSGPLPGGDIRGVFGGKAPILLIILLVVGLIAIAFLIKKFK